MVHVNERVVAELMHRHLAAKGLSFTPVPAEDQSVDAEVQVLLDGVPTVLHIQCGAGYVALNESLYHTPGDPESFYAVRHLGDYGVQPDDMTRLKQRLELWVTTERAARAAA